MWRPATPSAVNGIDDLPRAGLRYVNRQRGAGTRALLDFELGRRGIDPGQIAGYSREEFTHLAVAAAVAAGRADAGLGIRAAAQAFGLDFIPVAWEPYDLVLRVPVLEDRPAGPVVGPLGPARFPGASGAARRLLLSGDGPPDPVIPRPHLHPISTTLQVSQRGTSTPRSRAVAASSRSWGTGTSTVPACSLARRIRCEPWPG